MVSSARHLARRRDSRGRNHPVSLKWQSARETELDWKGGRCFEDGRHGMGDAAASFSSPALCSYRGGAVYISLRNRLRHRWSAPVTSGRPRAREKIVGPASLHDKPTGLTIFPPLPSLE